MRISQAEEGDDVVDWEQEPMKSNKEQTTGDVKMYKR